jgi:hypothetical protein
VETIATTVLQSLQLAGGLTRRPEPEDRLVAHVRRMVMILFCLGPAAEFHGATGAGLGILLGLALALAVVS